MVGYNLSACLSHFFNVRNVDGGGWNESSSSEGTTIRRSRRNHRSRTIGVILSGGGGSGCREQRFNLDGLRQITFSSINCGRYLWIWEICSRDSSTFYARRMLCGTPSALHLPPPSPNINGDVWVEEEGVTLSRGCCCYIRNVVEATRENKSWLIVEVYMLLRYVWCLPGLAYFLLLC